MMFLEKLMQVELKKLDSGCRQVTLHIDRRFIGIFKDSKSSDEEIVARVKKDFLTQLLNDEPR